MRQPARASRPLSRERPAPARGQERERDARATNLHRKCVVGQFEGVAASLPRQMAAFSRLYFELIHRPKVRAKDSRLG
jgi:hypothetical protein